MSFRGADLRALDEKLMASLAEKVSAIVQKNLLDCCKGSDKYVMLSDADCALIKTEIASAFKELQVPAAQKEQYEGQVNDQIREYDAMTADDSVHYNTDNLILELAGSLRSGITKEFHSFCELWLANQETPLGYVAAFFSPSSVKKEDHGKGERYIQYYLDPEHVGPEALVPALFRNTLQNFLRKALRLPGLDTTYAPDCSLPACTGSSEFSF